MVRTKHSYGFRPGRSAHDGVRAAQKYAQEGKDWVADMDITKFFDHVNHDILIGRMAQVIRDKRVLHSIRSTCGVARWPTGWCNIYVGSQQAAERTLASIQAWIEKHLRLQVNTAKSGIGRVWERKFLGFRLDREKRIGVAPESIERFQAKVREMWRGNQSKPSKQLRDAWVRYVRGWWRYSNWPTYGSLFSASTVGFDGTSGSASRCADTTPVAGKTRCAGWEFTPDCSRPCTQDAELGLWPTLRPGMRA